MTLEEEFEALQDGDTLNLIGAGFDVDEDSYLVLGGLTFFLNHIDYHISIVSEMDGVYDEIQTIPQLALEKPAGNHYTFMTSGSFHRIQFESVAFEFDDYGEPRTSAFHIRVLEFAVFYQGRLI